VRQFRVPSLPEVNLSSLRGFKLSSLRELPLPFVSALCIGLVAGFVSVMAWLIASPGWLRHGHVGVAALATATLTLVLSDAAFTSARRRRAAELARRARRIAERHSGMVPLSELMGLPAPSTGKPVRALAPARVIDATPMPLDELVPPQRRR
jgi:hypothetical protein